MSIGKNFKDWWSKVDGDEGKEVIKVDTSEQTSGKADDGLKYAIVRDKDKRACLVLDTAGYPFDDDHIDVNIIPGDDPEKEYSRLIEIVFRAEEFPKGVEVVVNHLGCTQDRTYKLKLPFAVKTKNAAERIAQFDEKRLLVIIPLEEYATKSGVKLPLLWPTAVPADID